jgi:hypothetical protein
MSAIDTDALDAAVRRFPVIVAFASQRDVLMLFQADPDLVSDIVTEYRLVLAESGKGRGA